MSLDIYTSYQRHREVELEADVYNGPLIIKIIEVDEESICPICIEMFDTTEILVCPTCETFYHIHCGTKWGNKPCPTCRNYQTTDIV